MTNLSDLGPPTFRRPLRPATPLRYAAHTMAHEALFSHIEKIQGAEPWGSVLDAGTGAHSLEWIIGLDTTRWTAVTADPARTKILGRRFGSRIRRGDEIVSGNWTDHAFLHGQVFDVVLADYLIGAVDFFAPYYQDVLLERLKPHVEARLYVVGLEPYREDVESPAAELILEIARLRDACIVLAGHRCYREFPLEWILRQLERAGYTIEDARAFPIVYGQKFINGQLDVCVQKLPRIRDRDLAVALEEQIKSLRERALSFSMANDGVRFGQDYVVFAKPDR